MKDKFTILCISSYEKGHDFIRQCKEEGARVFLLTSKSLENADWPKESIDNIFYINDVDKQWKMEDVIYGVSFLSRKHKLNRIVALDDFDVEKAASLREHLRTPGMGDTTARYFRDKLAMRMRAKEVGILVPDFVHVLNHDEVNEFMNNNEPPYVLKPRLQAGAIGIKKINNPIEFWEIANSLGDQQSFYLLEKFVPGDIYHVDTIVYNNKIEFAIASEYGKPPMEVAHEGRVFSTKTIKRGTELEKALQHLNKDVINSLGLVRGISHTEFIKSHKDGKLYFLETSARVGGANIHELVKAASGIDLWREWAKIEVRSEFKGYLLPEVKNNYAGLILSLAKQEWPNLDNYNEKEIVWKLQKKYHAGLVFASDSFEKVNELLQKYTERFYNDFFTSQPLPDKPTA
ncbi:MAG: ATP-grasp domain-containing protein [Melioribacteraceae bacterium]|nr:ATP-grasp domain-containing protein [Melioribacteraceae bacterium]